MTNTTVEFLPTERLITPTPDLETPYPMAFTATQLDRSDDLAKSEVKTKSGIVISNKDYSKRTYSITSLPCARDSEPTLDEWEMFAASTENSETFTMTNLDEGDRVMTVQVVGRVSRQSRVSAADVGQFPYSFTVREV